MSHISRWFTELTEHSKHAAAGLTKAMANEWSSKGININGLAPGYVATEMIAAIQKDETRSRQIMDRVRE